MNQLLEGKELTVDGGDADTAAVVPLLDLRLLMSCKIENDAHTLSIMFKSLPQNRYGLVGSFFFEALLALFESSSEQVHVRFEVVPSSNFFVRHF